MSRQEYLKRLGEALASTVSDRERKDILRYYEEYFDEAGPEREDEIIRELGDPEELAKRIAREGGFSGGEAADEGQGGRKKWMLPAAVCALAAVLLLAVVLLVTSLSSREPAPGGEATEPGTASEPASSFQQGSDPLSTPSSPQESKDPAAVSEEPSLDGTFTSIKVEISVGNILVRTGEAFDIEMESKGQDKTGEAYVIHHEVKKDRLRVWSTPKSIQTGEDDSIQGKVIITVPADCMLAEIDLKTALGDIGVEGVSARELEGKSGMGSLSAEGLNVTEELSLQSAMGSITLDGALARETDLETAMGSIQVDADCTIEACSYELECAMGGIELDGQRYKDSVQDERSAEYELEAKTAMGDIEVKFAK